MIAGCTNYDDWSAEMPPERRAEIENGVRLLRARMLMDQLRKYSSRPAEEIAAAFGNEGAEILAQEIPDGPMDDLPLDRLADIARQCGGRVELVAHLPAGAVRLTDIGTTTDATAVAASG